MISKYWSLFIFQIYKTGSISLFTFYRTGTISFFDTGSYSVLDPIHGRLKKPQIFAIHYCSLFEIQTKTKLEIKIKNNSLLGFGVC